MYKETTLEKGDYDQYGYDDYDLIKAQADMLTTELAQEKVRLSRFNRKIFQKSEECQSLENIVSYLMSENNEANTDSLSLENTRILIIGGTTAYGQTMTYFIESLGGQVECLSKEISEDTLKQHAHLIPKMNLVLFQSKTFAELALWNITRDLCAQSKTPFSVLCKPTLSCFVNRVSSFMKQQENTMTQTASKTA